MRDAETYEQRAANALMGHCEFNSAERDAQLDAMSIEELGDLTTHAEALSRIARRRWLDRVTKPRSAA